MEKNPPQSSVPFFSLRNSCKSRINALLQDLRSKNPSIPYFLLILDQTSLRMVSSCLKMIELMETGITAIEKLELKRKRFANMHAIYLLTPTSRSVDLLTEDFPLNSPQYGNVHLFFTNRLPKDLLKRIAENPELLPRVKTLKEIYQDFLCVEDHVFELDMNDAIPRLFSGENDLKKDAYMDQVAVRLGTVIVSFEKFYEVEIVYSAQSEISLKIARNLQSFLQFQFAQLAKVGCGNYDEKNSGKIVVVLFERSCDPLTPLLHDFFYQSMIYDLLSIKNNLFEYEEEDKEGKKIAKKAILTDNDQLFKRYQYKHIAEALDGIPAEFQKFISENTTAKLQQGVVSGVDLRKMGEIIKSLPQYNELLAKYSLHMKLIEKAWTVFEEKELKELGELEQSLATGITREGLSCKESKLLSSLNNFLLSPRMTSEDKLRIILITILTIEIPEKEKTKIFELLPFEDRAVIPKLAWFGYNIDKKEKKNKKIKEDAKKLAKSKLSSATLDLCRYTAKIETLCEEIVENMKKNKEIVDVRSFELGSIKINEKIGGSLAGPKSLKNKKFAMKIAGFEEENSAGNCAKIVMFGVGGLGFNEIRGVMDIARNQSEDVVFCVGGTSLLRPSDYLECLKNMNSLF